MPSATRSVSINRPINDVFAGWKALLMGRAVQSSMESEMGNLDALKRILES